MLSFSLKICHTQSHTYKNTNALSFSSFVLVSVFSFLFLSTKPFPRQLYSSLINMSCTEVKVKYFAEEKKKWFLEPEPLFLQPLKFDNKEEDFQAFIKMYLISFNYISWGLPKSFSLSTQLVS